MARAETIESAGETGGSGGGGRGNDPLPHHTCRMEVRCPTHSWPGLLTTSSIASGPSSILPYNHNHLHPLQPLHVDVEEHQEISSQREPLPDLLPQNERVSRGSPPDRAPRNQVAQDLEVRRVARQLRVIGDQFNATVLRRQVRTPFWQDLRDACRGVINFITQTLSTLYRMT
uniref:Uncharacterized LOC103377911 n=1 Tax=Cynoglossus semilaevis TaxID=244447 RepID=A0A3P8V5T7_CYNSE